MSNFIQAIDPLVKESTDTNELFHADEKMHYILVNNDIQTYLDYCSTKYNDLKYYSENENRNGHPEYILSYIIIKNNKWI
jgi:hypothetical protein